MCAVLAVVGLCSLYGTVAPAQGGALVGFQLPRLGRSVNEGGTSVTAGTASVSRFSAVCTSSSSWSVPRADQGRKRRRARLELQRADLDSVRWLL